ncbi:HAD family hydrolase [Tessaracoccus defluvii]|uniref:HAD family phosphatase n=1 Tax=Tessaracoccus defluvii TaxID=1285901 RepID=A0A7H0H991_9ACTN|nr:HAD family phosphatase [Tessaracoccus defluvii]QNP57107.1 HAD family phosphatase [Tessaracoccus defluvii]
MQAEAVVFDLDGTLIDTEVVWDDVRRGLARDAGLAWPEGATQAMMGMSTGEWSTHMVEAVGLPVTQAEAARLTIEGMVAHYRSGDLTLLPGALEAVRRMGAAYPIAIASSSPRILIDTFVEAMGLGDLLRVTVSTEEVDRGKPAPDGYLRACELLGVDPGKAVAVEDAPNGIRSALNAGMTVVAIPPHFHPPSADLLARTTVLEGLDELTPELIEAIGVRTSS